MKSVKRALLLVIVFCWSILAFGAIKPAFSWKLFGGLSRSMVVNPTRVPVVKPTFGIGTELRWNKFMAVEIDIYYINKGFKFRHSFAFEPLPELCGAFLIRLGYFPLSTVENMGNISVFGGYELGLITKELARGFSHLDRGFVAGFGYQKWLKNGRHGYMLEFRNRFEGPVYIPSDSNPYRSTYRPRTMSVLVGYMFRSQTGSKR